MIIKYDPKTIENVASFLNNEIDKNANEKYIMFIFNDIHDKVININDFYNKYVNLIETFDLPFAFYPYYIHFNKALKNSLSIKSPKMKISINKKYMCDIVNQMAYGMIIINLEKIKSINFKFDEQFKLCFYLQDLAEKCYQNKLYISASSFLDVPDSFNLVTDSFKNGHFIDTSKFAEEKTKFYTKNKPVKENLNTFITDLKSLCQKIKSKTQNKVELIEPNENL